MIVVMVFLVPFFRKLELVSVYEYLEHRFSRPVRQLVSFVFLLSRGLGAGVAVYASAIVLAVCLGIPLWATILLVGVVTIIYDTIGGITAVVYSDVIQMVILVGGILVCIVLAADIAGGFEAMWTMFPESRRAAIDPSTGLADESTAPFWAFLFGGFFLYVSYYGTDQSQVQRELSASSTADTKLSLLWNGLARFPLTILYVLLGIAMWAVYHHAPELSESVSAENADFLVPQFVLLYVPTGIRAVIFAALLAAAMSSLDSALNSLSAATMRDFLAPKIDSSRLLLYSKMTTVGWGILITAFAFLVEHISATILESVNKIGSAFYGPILATFLVGVLIKKVTPQGVLLGLPAGVGLNLFLWIATPGVHWMWWNFFGFAVTALVAVGWSLLSGSRPPHPGDKYILGADQLAGERRWFPVYLVLVAYFLIMLFVLWLL
jgi:SSS family solute:Na+ symporter